MASVSHVDIELRPADEEGPPETAGVFRLELLPGDDPDDSPAPLVDRRGDTGLEAGVEPVQVLESREYRYSFEFEQFDGPVAFDRSELFFPDTDNGRTGRFRPGLHIGTVPVRVEGPDQPLGTFALEVRTHKFEYLKHYRWMLRDLTETLTESVMERFAASEQQFTIDENRDAQTLYQRFALLKSLLDDERLRGAIRHVTNRPHVSWREERQQRSVRRGIRSSSSTAKQLAGPGPRVGWENGPDRLKTLPRTVSASKTYSTVDNAPNRFVQFALSRWRDVVSHVREVLEAETSSTTPIRRGIREARALEEELTALLNDEFFRDVGTLRRIPEASQVLQKRAGYRTVYKTYIEFELASKLSWEADDVYGAGQRNVATLYEYWTFLRITEIVADRCERRFDLGKLFSVQDDGLGVGLRRGTWQALDGVATATGGREMALELHYNRSFPKGAGSWTRNLRPDCSLRIAPRTEAEDFEDIWLHFDAKYRLDALDDVFEEGESPPESDTIAGTVEGEDLLKMHAYRDAIRRSAGAYVVYPGSDTRRLQEYHEVLPGLGAFPLHPTEAGRAAGENELATFVDDVIEHAASQVTQHERSRYWSHEAYGHDFEGRLDIPPAPFLPRPPADTLVLLGFVRSSGQYDWIVDQGLYNLRADADRDGSVGLGSRELAADLALLYGDGVEAPRLWAIEGEPRLMEAGQMVESGYPDPGGTQYFVLPVQPVEAGAWAGMFEGEELEELQRRLRPDNRRGAPAVTDWLRVVRFVEG